MNIKLIKKVSCMLLIAVMVFSCFAAAAEESDFVADVDFLYETNYKETAYSSEADETDIYADLNEVIQNYRKMYNIDVSLLYKQYDKETADSLAEQIIINCLIKVHNLDVSILYEIYDTELADAIAETYAEGYICPYCM